MRPLIRSILALHSFSVLSAEKRRSREGRIDCALGEGTATHTACKSWYKRSREWDFDVKNRERPANPKNLKTRNYNYYWIKNQRKQGRNLLYNSNYPISSISVWLHKLGKIQREGRRTPRLRKQEINSHTQYTPISLFRIYRNKFVFNTIRSTVSSWSSS